MSEQQTNEQGESETRRRKFGERFAAWWNRGAEKAEQGEATPAVTETAKREAA